MATAALSFCWINAEAQTVLKLPEINKTAEKSAGAFIKNDARMKAQVDDTSDGFNNPLILQSAEDKKTYSDYVKEKGSKPNMAPAVKNVSKASSNGTVYKYTGFNAGVGTDEDGLDIPGLVSYNLNPFECDTVSLDGGVSPYAYAAKGKLYCFQPIADESTLEYIGAKRTVYDANTLEVISSNSYVNNTARSQAYFPYFMTYDAKNDIVYAISMENVYDGTYYGSEYYLNILDTATCKLQRLGYLGSYWGYRNEGNYSPKGFAAGDGNLYVQLSDDSLYIAKINPDDCSTTIIGSTEMQKQYLYGQQPMIYEPDTKTLLVNHYDFGNGTIYYRLTLNENSCKTEMVEQLPTGYLFFYQRPETETHNYTYKLDDIADLNITTDADNNATITFTVPSTVDGGKNIPSGMAKTVNLAFFVDGNSATAEGVPASVSMGDKVSCNINSLSSAMHIMTVQITPSESEIGGGNFSKTITCGYDAPDNVSDATLTIENQVATISWTAPTKGLYDDFGSKFDASDITYTVVRDVDGKTIATDITETSTVDNELPEQIMTHSYTIYAKSHGTVNTGTKTNSVSAGIYMPMPYQNNFTSLSDMESWTVINANDDGSALTWSYNDLYGYVTCMGQNYGCDDWMISPAFNLKNDSLYMFSYQLKTLYKDYPASVKTTIGTGTTAEAQTTVLDDMKNFLTEGFVTKRIYFNPETTGHYNFGLYNYGVSMSAVAVDTVIVKAVASASAPNQVKDVSFTPDAEGALGGTLTFTLPSTDIAGKQISELNGITIYDIKGNELASKTGVRPGESVSLAVKAIKGYNTFSIVASNAKGEGWPVDFTRYVGPDTPMAVTDLHAVWGEEQNEVILKWTNPTTGKHGGYVNTDDFVYNIYKYDASDYPAYTKLGETTGESSVELAIMDASSNQDQYVFALTVSNAEGESEYVLTSSVLGTPYTLPYTEPFTATSLNHGPYIVGAGINNQAWTVDTGIYNTKIQPYNSDGLMLLCLNSGSGDGSSYFATPIISFENTEKPLFSVWLHHSEGLPENTYVKVQASTDGNEFFDVSDEIELGGNNGWQEHIIDMSSLNGKKAQIALYGYMPTPAARIFADNWNIYEASGKDLAVTGITQPYMPVVGDTATITVTVANLGADDAAGYSVLFNVDDETVDEIDPEETLAAGETRTFNFTLPITAARKNPLYNAQVLYDGDQNEENNISTDVELDPRSMDLAAPTSLVLTNEDLSWTAPEISDGREVLLDFESVPAFTIDNIAGWKTVDIDGNLTNAFLQYYGNYWPYAFQQLAWMTWSAKEAGCDTATPWLPYEGEKCLIHWGNYGVDAEGRPDTDPSDDWFISPEIKGGSELSFVTLSNSNTSSIEILTSSTDDQPESFTNKVATVDYPTATEWKEVSVTLPQDAKYVAIHTIVEGFGTLIDNIRYTEAKAPVLKGYNVYCNNNVVNSVTTNGMTATTNGTYAVSAVYDLGESDLSNTVSVTTGIADLTMNGVNVYSGDGMIIVKGAENRNVEVFSINGQKIAGSVAKAVETYNVQQGAYIVTVDKKPYKLIVK